MKTTIMTAWTTSYALLLCSLLLLGSCAQFAALVSMRHDLQSKMQAWEQVEGMAMARDAKGLPNAHQMARDVLAAGDVFRATYKRAVKDLRESESVRKQDYDLLETLLETWGERVGL